MSKIILTVEVWIDCASASHMYVDDKLKCVVNDMKTAIRNANDWDYPFMVWSGYEEPHPAELNISIEEKEV